MNIITFRTFLSILLIYFFIHFIKGSSNYNTISKGVFKKLGNFNSCRKKLSNGRRFKSSMEGNSSISRHLKMGSFCKQNFGICTWPKGRVPYVLDGNFNNKEKDIFACSMLFFKEKTCVKFVPRKQSDHSFVVIGRHPNSCYATLGYSGRKQELRLSTWGINLVVVIHEMSHAIGINHEHQRPDRDKYVKIYMNNVDRESQNTISSPGAVTKIRYDYASIMHYPSGCGSKVCISAKRNPTTNNKKMGMSKKPTKYDEQKINMLYKCKKKKPSSTRKPKPKPTKSTRGKGKEKGKEKGKGKGRGGKKKNGAVYVNTGTSKVPCTSTTPGCKDYMAPNDWMCNFKKGRHRWAGSSCYCDKKLGLCIHERYNNDQLEYTNCQPESQRSC